MGCAEMSMIALLWGLKASHGFSPPPCSPGFVFQSACDIQRSCRQVLLGWEGPIQPLNIFGDLLDRLPPHVLARYNAVSWPSKDDIEVYPPSKITEWVAKSMDTCERLLDEPGTFDDLSQSFCYNIGECVNTESHPDVLEGEHPDKVFKGLRVAVGGLTCLDFTTAGDQLGLAGPSTKVMMVFVAERKMRKEPMFVIECVLAKELLAYVKARLQGIYDIEHVHLDVKDDLGDPHARRRMFIHGVRMDMLVRTRPLEELKQAFKESLVGNGDMYFCMSDAHVKEDIAQLKIRARIYEDPGQEFAYLDVMPQYQQEHVQCFNERREDMIAAGKLLRTDSYVADVKDNAFDNHAKGATHMTTTLRKSVHYSFLKKRALLEHEMFFSMGIATSRLVQEPS
jgi:site-specific DNA-cytosine methylase